MQPDITTLKTLLHSISTNLFSDDPRMVIASVICIFQEMLSRHLNVPHHLNHQFILAEWNRQQAKSQCLVITVHDHQSDEFTKHYFINCHHYSEIKWDATQQRDLANSMYCAIRYNSERSRKMTDSQWNRFWNTFYKLYNELFFGYPFCIKLIVHDKHFSR